MIFEYTAIKAKSPCVQSKGRHARYLGIDFFVWQYHINMINSCDAAASYPTWFTLWKHGVPKSTGSPIEIDDIAKACLHSRQDIDPYLSKQVHWVCEREIAECGWDLRVGTYRPFTRFTQYRREDAIVLMTVSLLQVNELVHDVV